MKTFCVSSGSGRSRSKTDPRGNMGNVLEGIGGAVRLWCWNNFVGERVEDGRKKERLGRKSLRQPCRPREFKQSGWRVPKPKSVVRGFRVSQELIALVFQLCSAIGWEHPTWRVASAHALRRFQRPTAEVLSQLYPSIWRSVRRFLTLPHL